MLRKATISLCFCFIFTPILKAQIPNFDWLWHGRGDDVQVYDMVVDEVGNIYSVGTMVGTVDFDRTAKEYLLATSNIENENQGTFISKFDSEGNVVWARLIKGGVFGYSITLTGMGEVIVEGDFSGTVDFDPGPREWKLTNDQMNTLGKNIFLLKLNNNGLLTWAKKITNNTPYLSANPSFRSIEVDSENNIYLTGSFKESIDFEPGSGKAVYYSNKSNPNTYSAFISKFDKNGKFKWVKQIWTENKFHFSGISTLSISNSDSIYLTGVFSDKIIIDPNSTNKVLHANSQGNGFVIKLSGNGEIDWVGQISGLAGNPYGILVGPERTISSTLDANGNFYLSGVFTGSIDVDPGLNKQQITARFTSQDGNFGYEYFIAKFNQNMALQWVKQFSLMTSYENSLGSISLVTNNVDEYGNVYSVGRIAKEMDFDPGPEKSTITPNGGQDLFVCKLDNHGDFKWVAPFQDSIRNVIVLCRPVFCLDKSSNIIIGSGFQGSVDFDPSNCISIETSKNSFTYEGLIFKLSQVEAPQIDLIGDSSICEGDSLTLKTGLDNYPHSWNTGSKDSEIVVRKEGEYIVQVETPYCYSISDSVFVTINPKPTIKFSLDSSDCVSQTLYLSSGSSNSDIKWSTGEKSDTIRVTNIGWYKVQVSQSACTSEDSFYVSKLCPEGKAWIPNAFSPNHDHLNEVFKPVIAGNPPFELLIINQWGQVIFKSIDSNLGWDGTYQGDACPQGVYSYLIYYRTSSGKLYSRSGNIHLLR